MIIRVDTAAALPVYEQIREQVVRMVTAGTLQEGTRLPSIRQLASDLRLAKGTIAKAYALLEDAGVIESRGQRGSFVAPAQSQGLVDAAALTEAAAHFATVARQLGASLEESMSHLEGQWIDD